jgi:hypothetical protein
MMIKNQIMTVDGQDWKIREARNDLDAIDAIAMARCTGSVASKQTENGVVVADVVRLNPDGSERQPR